MCEQLDNRALEALANALGAPDPHDPVYPLIAQIATDIAENVVLADLTAGVVPIPHHTRYVSPSWTIGSGPLPPGYFTTIAAAYASILAETPIPLDSDKYVIYLNVGHYAEDINAVSNVDLVAIDSAVTFDGAFNYSSGSGINAGAVGVNEVVNLVNIFFNGAITLTGNPAKSAALVQSVNMLDSFPTTLTDSGMGLNVKGSDLDGAWNISGAGAVVYILNSVADSTWSLSATLGATAYIFDTTYPADALSTDATSGIDRQYTSLFAVPIAAGANVIALAANYVNPTYIASVTLLSTGTGYFITAKTVSSVTVNNPGVAYTADILLTQPNDSMSSP
jgi:hypothetical protein